MINAEKYKGKILNIAEDGYIFAINKNDKNNVIRCCSDMKCQDCMFDDEESEDCGYNLPRLKWLFAEYKERVKPTKLEHDVLKHCLNEGWNYIVRDKNGCLNAYTSEPKKLEDFNVWHSYSKFVSLNLFKNLFTFIKWEDENPRMIKDILDNCEVVNDAEE